MHTQSVYSQDDPISLALRPPPTETELERNIRLQVEAEACRVSENIDAQIRQDREKLKKSKGDVRLLLLGQAESGKSTLQKQFQLMYEPKSLDEERVSWRSVVYFNVVRSIKHILASLETWEDHDSDSDGSRPMHGHERAASSAVSPLSIINTANPTHDISFSDGQSPVVSLSDLPVASSSKLVHTTVETINISTPAPDTEAYQIATLRLRLSPLVSADAQLADLLSGGVTVSGSGKGCVFVRRGWQTRTVDDALCQGRKDKRSPTPHDEGGNTPLDEIRRMLDACKHDIRALWEHPQVKDLIARRRLRLEEWTEYFLDHIARISAQDYIPSTDDILHARIQTMGVAEYGFGVDIHGKTVTWHIYDVGGARGQRHTWVPYFDNANAIIFVAPISAFDQYLEEDPRMNRIDDSLQLFTAICSHNLLKQCHLVLFLNKTDILKAKLDKGLQVKKYITSYGKRSNDAETAMQYFRQHFLQVHRRNNEKRRVLYTHFTSVINTKATQSIIGNVRDSIFRGYLASASLV